jgi:hypothetical protein
VTRLVALNERHAGDRALIARHAASLPAVPVAEHPGRARLTVGRTSGARSKVAQAHAGRVALVVAGRTTEAAPVLARDLLVDFLVGGDLIGAGHPKQRDETKKNSHSPNLRPLASGCK